MNITQRITRVRNLCNEKQTDAVLLTSPFSILYLTDYLGFYDRDAYCLITPKNAYLLSNALYIDELRQQIDTLTLVEISKENRLSDSIKAIFDKEKLQTLGFEENNLTVNEYQSLKKKLPYKFIPLTLETLREIKDTEEIEYIQKACLITDKAFTYILSHVKNGMTEEKLAYDLEIFVKKQRADFSFSPVVAFGKNSAIPHHKPDTTTLNKNNIIPLDFGVKVHGYCSDMSRTIFFGKPTDEQKKVYETVRVAQEKAIEYINNATAPFKASDIDIFARNYIISQGYPSIPHSFGHGIGLEVHESPILSPYSQGQLTQNIVFTIEPGIYILGKFGVRIEDMFVIRHEKVEVLTHSSREILHP